MDRETRQKLKQARDLIRELLSIDTVSIEVDLPDDVIVWAFNECARRNITPNELIEEAVDAKLTSVPTLQQSDSPGPGSPGAEADLL